MCYIKGEKNLIRKKKKAIPQNWKQTKTNPTIYSSWWRNHTENFKYSWIQIPNRIYP